MEIPYGLPVPFLAKLIDRMIHENRKIRIRLRGKGGQSMFQKGDVIIYGNNGVCTVEKIGPLDSNLSMKGRVYYTLQPFYMKESRIFTPADNEKVLMRSVISKKEALELIDDIRNIDALWISDEKGREYEYKEAIGKCDCRELVKIIKTIYTRKQSRIAEGKKVTAVDEKYFHMAENSLYGELAIPMGMTKEAVKEYVIDRVNEMQEQEEIS